MHTIDLIIQKSAYGGYGLGFHNGKACFVQNALPEETVSIEIYLEKKDYSFGRIIQIIKKSEQRIEPECPNFGNCGGCDYLNIDYDTELNFKKEILIETLTRSRIDKKDIPEISLIKAERFHYRSHTSIKSSKHAFGFYEKDSNRLVNFPEQGCLLLSWEILQKLNTVPKTGGEIKIACSPDSGCVSSLDKDTRIIENECGILYERDISLFFQTNRFLRGRMLDTVTQYAEPDKNKNIIDIGCGVGFFTLFLAKNARKALGIDTSKESIHRARHNAKLNGIPNAFFKTLAASDASLLHERFETAIADPPRAGLSAKARGALKALAPERIVYISCDPATFARDARDLINSGRKLQKLTMIDMFPATHHIELIALFV